MDLVAVGKEGEPLPAEHLLQVGRHRHLHAGGLLPHVRLPAQASEVAAAKQLPKLAIARLDQVAELAEVSERELLDITTQPVSEETLATQRQFNQRYAHWLKNLLTQIAQTWPATQTTSDLVYLQQQLGRWLDSTVSN